MAQINNTTSYPEATAPLSSDSILIGSIASGGATNNFLMSDIANYVASTITFQDVCDQGSSTTTDITVGGVAYLTRLSVSSVASFSFVDVSAAFTSSSTANIADTLTLSKATGTGLDVTADVSIGNDLDVTGDADITGALEVAGVSTFANTTKVAGAFRLTATAPATSSSAGIPQTIAVDASYIYVCTATDTWGRVAIDTTPF